MKDKCVPLFLVGPCQPCRKWLLLVWCQGDPQAGSDAELHAIWIVGGKATSVAGAGKRGAQEQILLDHFWRLEDEIQKLRSQQWAVVKLLENFELLEQSMVTKERWVEIMKSSGLNDQDMQNWHQQFEAMEPEANQEFLESLAVKPDEIARIRSWSQGDV